MFEQNASFDFEVRPEPMYPLPFDFFECSLKVMSLPKAFLYQKGSVVEGWRFHLRSWLGKQWSIILSIMETELSSRAATLLLFQ